MNSRERFLAVLNFDSSAKNLKYEYGYWAGLLRNWRNINDLKINMPPDSIADTELIRVSLPLDENLENPVSLDSFLMEYFNLNPYPSKFPMDLSPRLPVKIIEDNSQFQVFEDNYGITQKKLKKGTSVAMNINYPVKNARDFDKYKEKYDWDFTKRLPADFGVMAAKLKKREFPVRLGGHPFGFSGMARHLMGDVGYMLGLYDNPGLIKNINEFFLKFVMDYWSEILKLIDIDWIMIWEDMAFKTGSFISKQAFEEFLSPYYIELVDFLKQFKVRNIIVDCDGLIEELIPLWLKTGVTGVFPMEAVNDILKFRQQFPKLQMLGGIDKRILFTESDMKIDDELIKVELLIKTGGYVPHIDHAIPMDADWVKFIEYRFKLNNLIDK